MTVSVSPLLTLQSAINLANFGTQAVLRFFFNNDASFVSIINIHTSTYILIRLQMIGKQVKAVSCCVCV